MTLNGSTSVDIYGQTYNVRGEGDSAYLTELARLVDARMHEVASRVRTNDETRIAILAALNIADELSRCKEESVRIAGDWMERAEELSERLGDEIGGPEEHA